jgi:hypothetical protein
VPFCSLVLDEAANRWLCSAQCAISPDHVITGSSCLVLASAPNKDAAVASGARHFFKSNKMSSASPKPVSSEDILGQKVSFSRSYIFYSLTLLL